MSMKIAKQIQLELLQDYMDSQGVVTQVEYSDSLNDVILDLSQREEALEVLETRRQTYPLPNASVRAVLNRCAAGLADVEVLRYSDTTGQLQMVVTSPEVDSIYQFVERLRQEDIFQVESYTGYEYVEADALWNVSVVVCLASEAGREG